MPQLLRCFPAVHSRSSTCQHMPGFSRACGLPCASSGISDRAQVSGIVLQLGWQQRLPCILQHRSPIHVPFSVGLSAFSAQTASEKCNFILLCFWATPSQFHLQGVHAATLLNFTGQSMLCSVTLLDMSIITSKIMSFCYYLESCMTENLDRSLQHRHHSKMSTSMMAMSICNK